MTTKQAIKKIKEMMRKDGLKYILKEAERLLESGGIAKVSYEDNYTLPKTILHVALLNCAEQYKPLWKRNKDISNLKHF